MLLQSLLRPVLTPLMRGMFDAPIASSTAWSPLALWPNGAASPGMWIDPSLLTASFNDSAGTTPVATPGSVADSANPVGLALDIRAGAPDSLGPELSPSVNWSGGYTTDAGRQVPIGWYIYTQANVSAMAVSPNSLTFSTTASLGGVSLTEYPANSNKFTAYSIKARKTATGTGGLYLYADTWRLIVPADAAVGDWYSASFETVAGIPPVISCLTAGGSWEVEYLSFKEIPGNHMLQSTSAARPLESAYDGQTLGPGDTYDATGYPIFQLYDGTDDSMATASFAAGTLINGMDCMIAVRRDSGANCVAGLYNGIADATKFFGMAESASGSGCVGSGAGTPTVWVDNTQLTGGTAVTRGTLHTALTAGSYHILEFRNLDLSAWTATGFGLYTSYVFPGARGDIMLFESTASTADKDAARQYLADRYGVTLA